MAQLITDDDIDFSVWEHETEARQQVKSASLWVQELIDRAKSPRREPQFFMPWGKTHKLIAFRDGETTLWGGENGTGKSLVTGQVLLSLCAQDQRVGLASFEMKPAKTLERMGRQWTKQAIDDPQLLGDSDEFERLIGLYEQFRDWTNGKLWLYDRQGTVQWRQVCAVVRYCAKELRIRSFVVDNLMKCVAGEDDYNGQKAFVDELCAIARDYGVHIHIVHHVRKPSTEGKKPTKYDLKGTGSISDQVDNVILIWRDKAKEKLPAQSKVLTQPDSMLIVDKQRNGTGWEGCIGLWYDHQSQQMLAGHNCRPMDFYAPPRGEEPWQ
jgi:twinkle protein